MAQAVLKDQWVPKVKTGLLYQVKKETVEYLDYQVRKAKKVNEVIQV